MNTFHGPYCKHQGLLTRTYSPRGRMAGVETPDRLSNGHIFMMEAIVASLNLKSEHQIPERDMEQKPMQVTLKFLDFPPIVVQETEFLSYTPPFIPFKWKRCNIEGTCVGEWFECPEDASPPTCVQPLDETLPIVDLTNEDDDVRASNKSNKASGTIPDAVEKTSIRKTGSLGVSPLDFDPTLFLERDAMKSKDEGARDSKEVAEGEKEPEEVEPRVTKSQVWKTAFKKRPVIKSREDFGPAAPGSGFLLSNKRALFSMLPLELISKLKKFPLVITASCLRAAEKDADLPLGSSNIPMDKDEFIEMVAMATTNAALPLSAQFVGSFELKQDGGASVTGDVTLFLRLTCYGKNVIPGVFESPSKDESEECYRQIDFC